MQKKQKIIALQKNQTNPQKGSSWNNSMIKWFIVHNINQLQSKSYQISLQIVYLSSKRQVKVNNQLKHSAMVTFGYESDFQIGTGLMGKIKQDGIQFKYELFINGVSFTQLEKSKPNYQPLSQFNMAESEINRNKEVKQKKQEKEKVFQAKYQKNSKQKLPITTKAQNLQMNQQQKIKDTQKELLKILKAQKIQKK